jgi:hypothetical protein
VEGDWEDGDGDGHGNEDGDGDDGTEVEGGAECGDFWVMVMARVGHLVTK